MTVIVFSPAVGPVRLDLFLREKYLSDLAITKEPVEIGADMTDHAYVEPAKLSLEIADNAGAATWAALERFQKSRTPFSIVTGLKVYSNMLIRHIEAERDPTYSRILYGKVDLDEVLIAETAVEIDTGGFSRQSPGAARTQSSTRASKPSAARASGADTKARVSGPVSRGDAVTAPVETGSSRGASILSRISGQ